MKISGVLIEGYSVRIWNIPELGKSKAQGDCPYAT